MGDLLGGNRRSFVIVLVNQLLGSLFAIAPEGHHRYSSMLDRVQLPVLVQLWQSSPCKIVPQALRRSRYAFILRETFSQLRPVVIAERAIGRQRWVDVEDVVEDLVDFEGSVMPYYSWISDLLILDVANLKLKLVDSVRREKEEEEEKKNTLVDIE